MPRVNSQISLSRQWHILKRLPRKGSGVSTRLLNDYLSEVGFTADIRTIQRDLVKLQQIFDIERLDKSKPHGWRWQAGLADDLPGLDTSDALTLHLIGHRLASLVPDAMTEVIAGRIQKARNTLEKNKDIGNWLDKVALVNESLDYLPPSISSVNLDTIQQAVIKDFQIQVIYQSISDPEPRNLVLHPLAMVMRGVRTYLLARRDIDKKDTVKAYALHRFIEVKPLTKKTQRGSFNLQQHIASGKMQFGQGEMISLHLKVDKDMFKILQETPLSETQILKASEDGGILTAKMRDSWALKWWILSKSEHLEVLKPASYRKKIAQILITAADKYRLA